MLNVFRKDRTSETEMIPKLEVGKWFSIDREVIDKNKEEIHRKCNEAGTKGKELWERFKESNKIADEEPDRYPRLIETYIFENNWEFKILWEMLNMCEEKDPVGLYTARREKEIQDLCESIGHGMCDEIICDLELMMRICNGEPVEDLIEKPDKLPRVRLIKLRNGGIGYFGGSADLGYWIPPSFLSRFGYYFNSAVNYYLNTPYAFRRVSSQD